MECEAVVGGEQGGEGDQALAIPVLVGRGARGGADEGGALAAARVSAVGAEQALLGAGGVPPTPSAQRDGQSDGLERLGRRQAGEGAPAGLRRRRSPRRRLALLARLLSAPRPSRCAALVLLEVAAEDEGVCGGEGALRAAQRRAGRVLQPPVQVEVVLALAAVRAALAVEGPLARVHAHVLDQLVGRLGQVAALLAAVVVAQAVSAHVGLQRGLVRAQSLADAAALLRLPVRLEVALHGRWTIGGVDAERASG